MQQSTKCWCGERMQSILLLAGLSDPYIKFSFDAKSKTTLIDQSCEKEKILNGVNSPYFAQLTAIDDSLAEHALEHVDEDATRDISRLNMF